MSVSRSAVVLESPSAVTLLQDVLSQNQISTIHSTIGYFSKFFEEDKKLDEREAKLMWIDDIQGIESSSSLKVLGRLEDVVQKNYFENFALEKAIINKPELEENSMFTKVSQGLKNSGITLKERISTAVQWIIKTLPKTFQNSVWKEALEWQRAQKTDIQHFMKTFKLYQKEKKAESRVIFGFFTKIGNFLTRVTVSVSTQQNSTQHDRLIDQNDEDEKISLHEKKQK